MSVLSGKNAVTTYLCAHEIGIPWPPELLPPIAGTCGVKMHPMIDQFICGCIEEV